MKTLATFILLCITATAFGQQDFTVDGFSPDYYGKVHFEDIQTADTNFISGSGRIRIYDKKSNKKLIEVEADDLFVFLHNNGIKANIAQLPYGEQSVILYEDFNFDGDKDFAIENGHMSCYGGPSFSIYLATEKGFAFNQAFTDLAMEYCGIFQVDDSAQTLHTMTKSGCCWHQYSTFKVKNNVPYPIKIMEERPNDTLFFIAHLTVYNRSNGAMEKEEYNVFVPQEGEITENMIDVLTLQSGKKMYLFVDGSTSRMHYILTDKAGRIELHYAGLFTYSAQDNTVAFTNKDTHYQIKDHTITVHNASGIYPLKGQPDASSITVDKPDIVKWNIKNLTVD